MRTLLRRSALAALIGVYLHAVLNTSDTSWPLVIIIGLPTWCLIWVLNKYLGAWLGKRNSRTRNTTLERYRAVIAERHAQRVGPYKELDALIAVIKKNMVKRYDLLHDNTALAKAPGIAITATTLTFTGEPGLVGQPSQKKEVTVPISEVKSLDVSLPYIPTGDSVGRGSPRREERTATVTVTLADGHYYVRIPIVFELRFTDVSGRSVPVGVLGPKRSKADRDAEIESALHTPGWRLEINRQKNYRYRMAPHPQTLKDLSRTFKEQKAQGSLQSRLEELEARETEAYMKIAVLDRAGKIGPQ